MGGHAEALLETTPPAVRLLGLDADPAALERARERLGRFGARVRLVHANFRTLARVARDEGVEGAEAVLLDLGVSTFQLEESGRGFSFQRDEPLDMRWDPGVGRPAADLLNRLDEATLARLLREYGEEPHARRIARAVVRHRPLRTTAELVSVIERAVPRRAWPRGRHVATRTFQALRIAVNDELEALRAALPQAAALLAPGGRLAVIAFHSGEDRLVKQAFRALSHAGYLPVEPAPLRPSPEEVRANPRARSARLRVLERVA